MIKHPLIWIAALLTVGLSALNWYQKQPDKLVRYAKDLPSILYLVQEAYVDEVEMDALMPGAFQGVLDAVDENASYIPAGEQPTQYRQKVFEQCGITLVKQNGYAYILSVAEGSPAQKAGVRPDTYIQQIGNQSTRLLSRYHIEKLLATTSPVELTLISPDSVDEEKHSFTPAPFENTRLAHTSHEGDVHVIRVPHFYKGLERELKKKLNQVKATKVILDLRNNAMGEESDLTRLASLFLPSGELASWVDAQGKANVIDNPKQGKFTGLELYLWINRGTSGAAESFAAVAQDHKAATIIGQESMGIPHRYQPIPLPSGGFLQLSTQDFVLHSGKTLTRTGITPDLALVGEDGHDIVLADALKAISNLTSQKVEAGNEDIDQKG